MGEEEKGAAEGGKSCHPLHLCVPSEMRILNLKAIAVVPFEMDLFLCFNSFKVYILKALEALLI